MAKFIRFLGPDGPTYGRVEDDVVYTLSGDLFGWWEETGEGFLLDGLKLLPRALPARCWRWASTTGITPRSSTPPFPPTQTSSLSRPAAWPPMQKVLSSPRPDPAGRV